MAAPFSSRSLREKLLQFPPARHYLIGFSGGGDSTALLVAMARQSQYIDASIEAVHFDHGLQPQSSGWKQHCRELSQQLGVKLTCHDLALKPGISNLENHARKQRYQWVEEHIDKETIYLTAHNADDRAETLLLNALRGSGLQGMASIPEIRPLGQGRVARPLLDVSHDALIEYLQRRDITWIEDPTNLESHQDRNFIRNQVMPLLESRWPAARQTLARTAGHLHGANHVLGDLLTRQLGLAEHDGCILPVEVVGRLGNEASAYVLRKWLRINNTPPVPEARLMEFLMQLKASAHDSRCELSWQGWSVRLYRNELWLLGNDECPACPEIQWDGESQLALGNGLGSLTMAGAGPTLPSDWVVGSRRPGAKIRIHEDGNNRKLKQLMSEQLIPPWQRKSVPVLYKENEVMAIGDWQLAPTFKRWLDDHGLRYSWRPELPGLRHTRARCHEISGHRLSA